MSLPRAAVLPGGPVVAKTCATLLRCAQEGRFRQGPDGQPWVFYTDHEPTPLADGSGGLADMSGWLTDLVEVDPDRKPERVGEMTLAYYRLTSAGVDWLNDYEHPATEAVSKPRAADLPVGSVVANEHTAWIKSDVDRWDETAGELGTFDFRVQDALDDGAQVLRVGDGIAQ